MSSGSRTPAPRRVGDRDRLGPGRERAVGRDARVVGRTDHRAHRLGPELRAGVGGRPAYAAATSRTRSARAGRPVVELLDVAGDRGGVLGQPAQALGVGPPRRRDPDALADHEPEVDRDVRLGDVLVDLAVGEPGQRGVLGRDEGFGLGHALAQRVGQCRLGQAQCVLGAVVVHRLPPAPTTCRPRPGRPGTARPARRARRGRSGPARPCRSSASRASRSSTRRRRRRTSARTRR